MITELIASLGSIIFLILGVSYKLGILLGGIKADIKNVDDRLKRIEGKYE